MRSLPLLISVTILLSLLSGCARQRADGMPLLQQPSVETQTLSGASLLAELDLTLPDTISRKSVSDTRELFYKDGAIIGGIELLDIADQMRNMDLRAYSDLALSIVRSIYDTEYDYMAESGAWCAAIVSVCDRDGREYYHYFYHGSRMGYDVWIDNSILDGRKMRKYLKTLHSEDLYNPQDEIIVNDQFPLLNLCLDLPEGISYRPTKTTRILFYSQETLAGGIEQIESPFDQASLGALAVDLSEALYGGKFHDTLKNETPDPKILSALSTDNGEIQLLHLYLSVGAEYYDVWVDTSRIPEESVLLIAQSCEY